MFTLPIPRRVRTWLIRIKGVTRLEHNPAVDASELWNRTATPETLAKLAGMALKLASVPDCPYHKQHTLCRYERPELHRMPPAMGVCTGAEE